jgi:5-carboxymethyl-2-hydroxymuconate isomerase
MYLKVLLLYLITFISLSASWLDAYRYGTYLKDKDKIYSLVEIDQNRSNYKQIAFKEAISDISKQLHSHVSSEEFLQTAIKNDDLNEEFTQKIHVISNLPIHGAIKEREKFENSKYFLLLSFDKKATKDIYITKTNELSQQIDNLYKEYVKESNLNTKIKLLNLIEQNYDNYEKYSLIATLLGSKNPSKPQLKKYKINSELDKIYNSTTKNIEELSKVLAMNISKTDIDGELYIDAFAYKDSDTFSDFSSKLQSQLEYELNQNTTIKLAHNAPYTLHGNYFVNDNFIRVKAIIYDKKGNKAHVIISKMTIKPSQKDSYVPKQNSFTKINDKVTSKELDVQVRMNKKRKNLLFREGQSVSIEVKTNKQAYVYVIANMRTKENKQVQYLLTLSNAYGNNSYQMFIPARASNKWINIGEFEIQPPFGVEVLHIFATNHSIVDNLPKISTKMIDSLEYDVIVDQNNESLDAQKSIAQFRGLKKKKKNALQKSEAILRFTTVAK